MTIYVVIGATGEYSDREEWIVKAFRDENLAKNLVLEASARAREIQLACTDYYPSTKHENEFDPKMQMSYNGTYYNYSPVELVD